MAKAGYGADIVMESLGGRYFQASFDSLNDESALVTFGSSSSTNPGLGLNMLRLVYRYITRPRFQREETEWEELWNVILMSI